MNRITFVKKILASGELCPKCKEVNERLKSDQLMQHIDEVMIADERDPSSPGMQLANEHQVQRAPFFIVHEDDKQMVFDVYFKFRKFLAEQGKGQLASVAL